MHRGSRLLHTLAAGAACMVLSCALAAAATPYGLVGDSTFQEGCFAPCLCPLLAPLPMAGSFRLQPTGTDGSFQLFDVTRVDWTVPVLGNRITGSGTFRLGTGVMPSQQLVLDLQVNDGPVERYDSGLVATTVTFPAIEAMVMLNNLRCHDRPLSVTAVPVAISLQLDDTGMRWSPVPGATGYDVVYGDLAAQSGAQGGYAAALRGCLGDDITGASLAVTPDPPVGGLHWFLVRDVAGSTSGSYDSGQPSQAGSRDDWIQASGLGCP
ncbi:MAG: hypothetical protein ACE5HU_10840 [Acidobacteriota bacterium]